MLLETKYILYWINEWIIGKWGAPGRGFWVKCFRTSIKTGVWIPSTCVSKLSMTVSNCNSIPASWPTSSTRRPRFWFTVSEMWRRDWGRHHSSISSLHIHLQACVCLRAPIRACTCAPTPHAKTKQNLTNWYMSFNFQTRLMIIRYLVIEVLKLNFSFLSLRH